MNLNNSKISKLEITAVIVIFLILIGFNWRIIGAKELISTHDTLYGYNTFYYFSDSLLKGHIPYWDPYTNAGEPNFIIWQLGYLLRPTVFIWLFLAKIFHLSLLTVWHLEVFTVFAIFCLGCYLFFRKIFQSKTSAFIAFIAITFSSLGAMYWWQFAFIMTAYTLPWVLLFTFYFLEGRKKALIPLAFFAGISLLGVYGMFFVFYYVILLLMLWLTGSFPQLNIIYIKQNSRYFILSLLVFVLLTLHLLPQFFYKDNIIPTGRFLDNSSRILKDITPTFEGLKMSFHAQFSDFFGLFFPHFSAQYFNNLLPWVSVTGIVMYVGLIPLIFLFIGLLWGNNRYKWGFFLSTIIIMLLMLGTRSFVLQFAYYFFPKFSWVQHMGMFFGFFIFNLCFFIGLGADKVMKDAYSGNFLQIKKYSSLVAIFSIFYFIILGSLIGVTFLLYSKLDSVFKDKAYGIETLNKIPALFSSFIGAFFYTAFFLLMAAFFFHILKRNEVSFKNKTIFLAFFIIIDLLAINYSLLDYTTAKRTNIFPEYPTETKYEDLRISQVKDLPPGFVTSYVSGILKKFSAYSLTDFGGPADIIESKDFYQFRISDIAEKTKDAILGITFPRLRLFNQAIVGSPDKIINFIDNNSADQSGRIKVVKFDSNRLELTVSTEQNAILYYSDGYDKYWEATIDGKKTKIYKTIVFKSIILPVGEHSVKFIYNPWPFKIGLYSYLLVLICFSLWVLASMCSYIRNLAKL